jgi:hypothetical protein
VHLSLVFHLHIADLLDGLLCFGLLLSVLRFQLRYILPR